MSFNKYLKEEQERDKANTLAAEALDTLRQAIAKLQDAEKIWQDAFDTNSNFAKFAEILQQQAEELATEVDLKLNKDAVDLETSDEVVQQTMGGRKE